MFESTRQKEVGSLDSRDSGRSYLSTKNKPMKTIITSNWRPSHRGLCAVLLCIAALWTVPITGHAQLKIGSFNASRGGFEKSYARRGRRPRD